MWPRGLKYEIFHGSGEDGKSRLMWPRGLKYSIDNCVITYYVEAYVASWIEISVLPPSDLGTKSRLMWPRGLKFVFKRN